MTTRIVNIFLDAGEKVQISEQTDRNELLRTIGYLSSWALDYPRVDIYRDGETDLVATYFNENNERVYTIGAVWHDDHYGFHS